MKPPVSVSLRIVLVLLALAARRTSISHQTEMREGRRVRQICREEELL